MNHLVRYMILNLTVIFLKGAHEKPQWNVIGNGQWISHKHCKPA